MVILPIFIIWILYHKGVKASMIILIGAIMLVILKIFGHNIKSIARRFLWIVPIAKLSVVTMEYL